MNITCCSRPSLPISAHEMLYLQVWYRLINNGGIINPLLDGLTSETREYLYFFWAPKGKGKVLRISQNIRAYYTLYYL